MLTIRREQLEAFRPVTEAEFTGRIADHLRSKHSRSVLRLRKSPTLLERLSDELLREMVRNGIERARSYGLSWESSISGFVVLMFTVAPNFDQHPIVQRVLTASEVAPDERMKLILSEMKSSNWQEAKDRYDSSAWQSQSGGVQV